MAMCKSKWQDYVTERIVKQIMRDAKKFGLVIGDNSMLQTERPVQTGEVSVNGRPIYHYQDIWTHVEYYSKKNGSCMGCYDLCIEIKNGYGDLHSGNGLNFCERHNFIAVTGQNIQGMVNAGHAIAKQHAIGRPDVGVIRVYEEKCETVRPAFDRSCIGFYNWPVWIGENKPNFKDFEERSYEIAMNKLRMARSMEQFKSNWRTMQAESG